MSKIWGVLNEFSSSFEHIINHGRESLAGIESKIYPGFISGKVEAVV